MEDQTIKDDKDTNLDTIIDEIKNQPELNKGKKGNKSEIIATILLISILVIASTYLAVTYVINQDSKIMTYTKSYINISLSDASNLINQTNTTLIIDCRGLEGCGNCTYKRGHLPGSVQNVNPLTLYNTTNDILVYSVDGNIGAQFCEDLENNVYGKIYNLDGGYDAWKAAGYRVETG